MAAARWPVVHEAHNAGGYDDNGYQVPEGWAAGVDRTVFSWEPETVNVEVAGGYQMRVTSRIVVLVPDVSLYGPNDNLVLGLKLAQVDTDPQNPSPRHRVDELRDMSHSPFREPGQMTPFGAAPGALVVERVSG